MLKLTHFCVELVDEEDSIFGLEVDAVVVRRELNHSSTGEFSFHRSHWDVMGVSRDLSG